MSFDVASSFQGADTIALGQPGGVSGDSVLALREDLGAGQGPFVRASSQA